MKNKLYYKLDRIKKDYQGNWSILPKNLNIYLQNVEKLKNEFHTDAKIFYNLIQQDLQELESRYKYIGEKDRELVQKLFNFWLTNIIQFQKSLIDDLINGYVSYLVEPYVKEIKILEEVNLKLKLQLEDIQNDPDKQKYIENFEETKKKQNCLQYRQHTIGRSFRICYRWAFLISNCRRLSNSNHVINLQQCSRYIKIELKYSYQMSF